VAAFNSAISSLLSANNGTIPRWSVDGRYGKQVITNQILSDPTGNSTFATIIQQHAGCSVSVNVGTVTRTGVWGSYYKTTGSVIRYVNAYDTTTGPMMALSTGNSGNVSSPHYTDLAVTYAAGQYRDMPWCSYNVETITLLVPATASAGS
jgi:acyl-homoserine lactone acylase PvdQ